MLALLGQMGVNNNGVVTIVIIIVEALVCQTFTLTGVHAFDAIHLLI